MAEKELEQSAPNAPAQRPRITRGQQRRRQRSVFQYITILFAAALVLLLYTFIMERRQFELQQQENQANISDLQQQSVSAVQTLNGLIAENEQLKQQVQDLTGEKDRLEKDLSAMEEQSMQLHQELDRVTQALDWFWQIDEAYVRGKIGLCRDLIQSFEETGLKAFLPQESTTGTDRPSPAQRYQDICDKVIS